MEETQARRRVGRLFALRLPASISDLDLDHFPVANYIVFGDALGPSYGSAKTSLQDARASLRSSGIEALLMMDEEGGRVTQISQFFPSAPSPRAVSGLLTPDEAAALYSHLSEFIAGLGIDINLFPCLDVNTNPLNPVIGTRAFGEAPIQVSSYGLRAISSSQSYVAAVGKHFPGHGMTRADSHLELPVVDEPASELESAHLPPFADAIRSGIDGVMIGHCRYRSLQSDALPASLSESIVGDLLRRTMRFRGLAITDSLDMDAVTEHVDPVRAAMLAFEAGCDILLYTEYSERFERAFEAVVAGLLSGKTADARVGQSLERREYLITRLRSRGRDRATGADRDTYTGLRNRVLEGSLEVVDPSGLLPIRSDKIVTLSTDGQILEKLRAHIESVTEFHMGTRVENQVLLLWMMEPLRLTESLETIRDLIERSGISLLVTTYQRLADLLPGCSVTAISRDSSPASMDRILTRLFPAP